MRINRAKLYMIFVNCLTLLLSDLIIELALEVSTRSLNIESGKNADMLGKELIKASLSYLSTKSLTLLFFSFDLTMSLNFYFNLTISIVFCNNF